MSNLTVKEVSKIVREYFDDIKKSKFIFDVISITFDEDEEEWDMECEISNVFDEEPRHYRVTVDDGSGEIQDVSEGK
ncbi:MAG: hypothetical protein JSW00_16005 [Thermoplasmata archaeon]|nr:MAG: hypothetical protein JSW00_16005 [Thermoplasmata archaeon]